MDDMKKSVVSMLVSSDKITLFTITGELIEIKNDGDYDTAKISEFLTPKLSGLSAVEINLNDYSRIATILPADLESEGIVVTQIINGREVQGIFYPRKVAVEVSVGGNKIIVPDIENLTGHIKRAVEEKSPSVANFLKRLAPVLDARKHSGEDLMKFIKQSEMPLTNDGRIIAYKRVNTGPKGYFVDCHTGKVKQRVGTRVKMKVDLVDSSRHNSCSTGLHVANLGYMQGFRGSHTLIVLVNPEDFIAVPKGETTKARVCSYDVIGVLSSTAHDTVNTGAHVTNDAELKALVKKAVEGTHVIAFEEVEVGNRGEMLSTTSLGNIQPKAPVEPVAVSSGTSLNEGATKAQPQRDVVAVTRAAQAKTTPVALPDQVIEAFDLLLSGVSKNQVADRFETSSRSIGRWMEKHNFDSYKAAAQAKAAPIQNGPDEWDNKEDLEAAAEFHDKLVKNGGTNEGMGTMMPKPKEETAVKNEDFAATVQTTDAPKTLSKVELARKLYNELVLSGFSEKALQRIKDFKKESKKGWPALGLTSHEIGRIEDAS
jgi:hypothetical protein